MHEAYLKQGKTFQCNQACLAWNHIEKFCVLDNDQYHMHRHAHKSHILWVQHHGEHYSHHRASILTTHSRFKLPSHTDGHDLEICETVQYVELADSKTWQICVSIFNIDSDFFLHADYGVTPSRQTLAWLTQN